MRPIISWILSEIKKSPLVYKGVFFLYFLGILIMIYGFFEARTLWVEDVTIHTGIEKKIILLSDLHLGSGIWKGEDYLSRIVEKTNNIQADYIFIAGDFTFYPSVESLPELFSPFKKSNKPIYAVLGNHDVGLPGPLFKKELQEALTKNNVHLLENETVDFSDFSLFGAGEMWEGKAEVSRLVKLKHPEKTIVLLHNPDILASYPIKNIPALTLAGHTHGGQIRIPWLYKKMIPSDHSFDSGFGEYEVFNGKKARYFISHGIGETALPIRFLCPPTIYVIDLH